MAIYPDHYQKLAARTECDQEAASKRRLIHDGWLAGSDNSRLLATRLSHAAMGLAGEVGELNYALEKWLQYGQDLDTDNVKEELGDILWYVALACNALDIKLSDVMEANIAKLKKRFPDKYSDEDAAEENRDRRLEMDAVTAATGPMDHGTIEEIVKDHIPKGVYSESQLLDIKARNVAKKDHLCPRCKNLVNDEIVRNLFINQEERKNNDLDVLLDGCPNCGEKFTYKDLVCLR